MTLRNRAIVGVGVLVFTAGLLVMRLAWAQTPSPGESADAASSDSHSEASQDISQLYDEVGGLFELLRGMWSVMPNGQKPWLSASSNLGRVRRLTEHSPAAAEQAVRMLAIHEIREAIRAFRDAESEEAREATAEALIERLEVLNSELLAVLQEVTPIALDDSATAFRRAVEQNLDAIQGDNRLLQRKAIASIRAALGEYGLATRDWRWYAQPTEGSETDAPYRLSKLEKEEVERRLDRLYVSNTAANREALKNVLASVLEVMGAEGDEDVGRAADEVGPSVATDKETFTLGELMARLRKLDNDMEDLTGGLTPQRGLRGLPRQEFDRGRSGGSLMRGLTFENARMLLQEPTDILGDDWRIPGQLAEAIPLAEFEAMLEQDGDGYAQQTLVRLSERSPEMEQGLNRLLSVVLPEAHDQAVANLLGVLDEETWRVIEGENWLRTLDTLQQLQETVQQYITISDAIRQHAERTGEQLGGNRYVIGPLAAVRVQSSLSNAQSNDAAPARAKRELIQVLTNLRNLLDPSSSGVARDEVSDSRRGPVGGVYEPAREPTGWTFYTPYSRVRQPDEQDARLGEIRSLVETLRKATLEQRDQAPLRLELRPAKDAEREQTKERLRAALTEYFESDLRRREEQLGKIEQRVARLREQLQRRRDKKDEIVDLQLKIAVNEADGLGFFSAPAPNGAARPIADPYDDIRYEDYGGYPASGARRDEEPRPTRNQTPSRTSPAGSSSADPFAPADGEQDPFGDFSDGDDPFGGSESDDPFGGDSSDEDPFR